MELNQKTAGTSVELKPVPSALYRVAYLSKDFDQYLWFSEHYGSFLQVEYFEEKEDLLSALKENFSSRCYYRAC